jgi:hypothetical protein
MDLSRLASSAFAPWAGLVAGMFGELVHHQVLSDLLRFDCRRGGGGPGLVLAVAVLVLIALGAWLSWLSAPHPRPEAEAARDANRRFIARMSLMATALFSVAVAWQTMAGFILPACPP